MTGVGKVAVAKSIVCIVASGGFGSALNAAWVANSRLGEEWTTSLGERSPTGSDVITLSHPQPEE
jgi:hypothetical protein